MRDDVGNINVQGKNEKIGITDTEILKFIAVVIRLLKDLDEILYSYSSGLRQSRLWFQ